MGNARRRSQAQALVEFAIALPILILVVAGVLELGRGYSYAVAVSDAARDGARYVAGKTVVAVYCGASADCAGSANLQAHSEVDVYVYYGFNVLNLLFDVAAPT